MSTSTRIADALAALMGLPPTRSGRASLATGPTDGAAPPVFADTDAVPVSMTEVRHPDGRMSRYPPSERWDDWVEWESTRWPERVARRYTLVPTICFNCEAACGLLAYVDRTTFEIRRFEGNPVHPGSRGRNCAKGPATHNQTYDPERILYPLKRVGARGEGRWRRVSWDEVLEDVGAHMRRSRQSRRDGIMYHVGRPGEDHYANRVVTSFGVDGHNSHTNVCSAAARTGYALWSGYDRPSPDYAHARCVLLLSSHLEAGHYMNPHAQRIAEARAQGAPLIVLDPRLSNTASKADVWLPTWPGSETVVLLAIARHLIESGAWDRAFVERWVDWRGFCREAGGLLEDPAVRAALPTDREAVFDDFERALRALYRDFSFERAAAEADVPVERVRAAAEAVARAGNRLAAHNWRGASIGNRGGWQVARALFLLTVLTGSIGTQGGTHAHTWNKFVPRPPTVPPPVDAWNELQMPLEWPLAHFEMSFLLPHLLLEDRGRIDVYFTRVYNPLWTNPDGSMWWEVLRDEARIGLHVALTPTWSETAWLADYVLPMGHAGERHDLMSQETHAGQWIGFRQPVRRVAMERAGRRVDFTWQANPGEVWEEAEFWVELAGRMDPDGALGVRRWFESPKRPGALISQEEYWSAIFETAVPGLPETAAREGLTPLQWMRRYGAFEVGRDLWQPHERRVEGRAGDDGLVRNAAGAVVGVLVDGEPREGFATPSRRLELLSTTLAAWGWKEPEYVVPWPLPSHVAPSEIDRAAGDMVLLPNFRLPTLIHTRSANAKWLVELSHNNPGWMHPSDASRLGLATGDLVRVETEIGWFVDRVWVTEGIKPGILAVSHHLGRWRLAEDAGVARGASSLVRIDREGMRTALRVLHGAGPYASADPDTSRIWWSDVGVHQNLAHAVHPDPVSGAHCWLQKVRVRAAGPEDRHGDVVVDRSRSMEVYRAWRALTRSAADHSPDGTRRPLWLGRPLRPTRAAYDLPRKA
jgi:anaerobic selenocysteine-containing dehydrogenase